MSTPDFGFSALHPQFGVGQFIILTIMITILLSVITVVAELVSTVGRQDRQGFGALQ